MGQQDEVIQAETDRLTEIYEIEVLTRKTRKVELPGRKCQPRLIRSFLGYELVVGKKRLTCPDMITARYLRIFAELGLDRVELPYDLTDTAKILPAVEESFRNLKAALEDEDSPAKVRRIYRKVRTNLKKVERDST